MDEEGFVSIPKLQKDREHNGHIFYLIHKNNFERDLFIQKMRDKEVNVVFHYIPLHNSPYAIRHFNLANQKLKYTESMFNRISRIPLWLGVNKEYVLNAVIESLYEIKKER